jgi:hypothetical protein
MSSITINPQGQTLTLSAATTVPGGAAAKLYSNQALTAAVTLPQTITTTTTYWTPDGTLNLTLTSPDGTSLLPDPFACSRPVVFTPLLTLAQLSAAVSTNNGNIAARALSVDVQAFTSSGTWTKPTGAKYVVVDVFGGSGGGGSGRRGAAATLRSGGAGGGSGRNTRGEFLASSLPATVAVTVGAAGAGGAAVTTNDTDGNPGGAGGISSFTDGTSFNLQAAGGTGGAGGTAAGATGGIAGSTGGYAGSAGANATAGAAGAQAGDVGAHRVGVGGASGGGIDATDVAYAGGSSSVNNAYFRAGNNAGGANTGGVGTAGEARPITSTLIGQSGSGGGASLTTAGGAGGAGGRYCAGGAGGGASVNGFNSGAGGAGTAGLVVVTSYF